MVEREDTHAAFMTFVKDVLYPLMRAGLYAEMCEEAERRLAMETDPDLRFAIISTTAMLLYQPENRDLCLYWSERLCEEFDDWPFAWTHMAMGFRDWNDAANADNLIALGHYETALQRAYAADQWVRYVLFDICRHLTQMEDWPALEARMREIIADLENTREIDIPFLEDDWLRFVMPGLLDADLVARYQALVAADRVRRRGLSEAELRPATIDELEP